MSKSPAKAVEKADLAAVEAARPWSKSRAMKLVSFLSEVGDQPPMRFLCASVIAAGLVRGDRRLAGAGLRMLAAHSLATFAKDAIKHRIDRTRPRSKHRPGKDHRLSPGKSTAKEETSFPSGHSAGAAAAARAFVRDYPEHAAPTYAAAGAVALAQIPRCAHYPSDVGAGLAIGVAAEALVDAVFNLVRASFDTGLRRRSAPTQDERGAGFPLIPSGDRA
jgi:membrane-associated phospholipid phosphatase